MLFTPTAEGIARARERCTPRRDAFLDFLERTIMADTPDLGFHAKEGWYFKRLEDGQVEVKHMSGKFTVCRAVFDKDTWASIVASVSSLGEDGSTFRRAEALHGGFGLSEAMEVSDA